jgi:beta-alanine--pyruvate transaminase
MSKHGRTSRRSVRTNAIAPRQRIPVRYGGDTIQLAPPFIVEKHEIDRLVEVLGEAIASVD